MGSHRLAEEGSHRLGFAEAGSYRLGFAEEGSHRLGFAEEGSHRLGFVDCKLGDRSPQGHFGNLGFGGGWKGSWEVVGIGRREVADLSVFLPCSLLG